MDETISAQPSAGPLLQAARPVPATPPPDDIWAICCSGTGMRAAAYCLGGLQSLDERGLLDTDKANCIVGASGGSYIAASWALVASNLDPPGEPRAYARGTPEEQNLLGSAGRAAVAASLA
jgi:predicted acylesterase/phospholipase RssA